MTRRYWNPLQSAQNHHATVQYNHSTNVRRVSLRFCAGWSRLSQADTPKAAPITATNGHSSSSAAKPLPDGAVAVRIRKSVVEPASAVAPASASSSAAAAAGDDALALNADNYGSGCSRRCRACCLQQLCLGCCCLCCPERVKRVFVDRNVLVSQHSRSCLI